eukprot:GHVR01093560.1.p1 GENE.GHVR01093560.1~~GHVR01093560.1.p1  ORF type:complete len:140 (+),score=33.62 GHVR01093560.1:117-536(+)
MTTSTEERYSGEVPLVSNHTTSGEVPLVFTIQGRLSNECEFDVVGPRDDSGNPSGDHSSNTCEEAAVNDPHTPIKVIAYCKHDIRNYIFIILSIITIGIFALFMWWVPIFSIKWRYKKCSLRECSLLLVLTAVQQSLRW